jgi:hypothetical protein
VNGNAGVAVMLAYYFPPLAGVASDRAASLATLLPSVGWEPIVITAREGFYHRAGEDWNSAVHVERTRSLEVSRAARAAYMSLRGSTAGAPSTTVSPVPAGRAGSGLRELVREYVYVPDAQFGWIPFAARAAIRSVRRAEHAAVMWSSSVPYSAHVAAMLAARRTGARWVAEFRDPWSTAHPINLPRSDLRRSVNLRIERRIVEAADHVVVLSEGHRAALLDRHSQLPPSRVSVVTNGFTLRGKGSPPPPEEKMSILYAGVVATGEDPSPVLAALDRVHAERPDSFRLVVLGPAEPWRRRDDHERRPWLELRGVVSPGDAREAMRSSSTLLLVQSHPAYRMVLPGKSFEYIGSKRPILAVVPPGWELTGMLERYSDSRRADSSDQAVLVSTVMALLDEHAAGTLQAPRVPDEQIAPLQRSEQVKKLAAIFDRLTSGAA